MFLVYLTEIFLLSYSEKGNTVPGCDFLVNSVWPEIEWGLEEKLPLGFNPENTDGVHQVPFPLLSWFLQLLTWDSHVFFA